MNIPEEAVEAATKAIYFDSLSNGSRHTTVDLKVVSRRQAVAALTAAAPMIKAPRMSSRDNLVAIIDHAYSTQDWTGPRTTAEVIADAVLVHLIKHAPTTEEGDD